MKAFRYGRTINLNPGDGEVNVLFTGHSQTNPLHKFGPTCLDYYLVHTILSGNGIFESGGQYFALGPGDCFFIYPGELISYISDKTDPWRYRWIGFNGSIVDRLLMQPGISPQSPIFRSSGRRMAILFHLVQEALINQKPGVNLEVDGYMRLIFAEIANQNYTAPSQNGHHDTQEIGKQVEKAVQWLTLQYHEPISIEELAKELGYHRTYLSRVFKLIIGLTPKEYLMKIRMEQARKLLYEPLTIREIGAAVGFPDPLYFSKQFRKWYGTAPTDYRNTLTGK